MITIVGMICGTLIVLVLMGMVYNFKQGVEDGWKEGVDETLNEFDGNFRLVARDMNRTETAINDILLALDKHEIKVEDTWIVKEKEREIVNACIEVNGRKR